jgi:uridine kinase
MADISQLADEILSKRRVLPDARSMLVALSGIDASGKGYLTSRVVAELHGRGVNAVAINLDGWLNLPGKRFNADHPAETFYRDGFRFDEMFEQLILPLKRSRSITLDAKLVEETAKDYHDFRYEFRDVDIIVLEGIFLIQPAFRNHHDLTIWVECSFETALERAINRGQEGLPPEETTRAFDTIYFPAQRIHFERDNPKSSADLVVINDDRLLS